MAKSSVESALPDDLIEQALAVIQADRLPYLATVEGDQPRLRPIAPVKTDGFIVYIANLRTYGKTSEIEANPRVELCYLDGHHDQVRITGLAEVVSDAKIKQTVWDHNPHIHKYMVDPTNPDFVLYRVVPTRVRFMKEWALTYREVPFQRPPRSSEGA
jgi:uncharacterized pyridoxamine 5'-phosphate oxidase family protein